MAWPRIRNSRSSAQPGTQPHNGVQATVIPAPDAEPPPSNWHAGGANGRMDAPAHDYVAYDYDPYDQGPYRHGPYEPAPRQTGPPPWPGRRVPRVARPPRAAASPAQDMSMPQDTDTPQDTGQSPARGRGRIRYAHAAGEPAPAASAAQPAPEPPAPPTVPNPTRPAPPVPGAAVHQETVPVETMAANAVPGFTEPVDDEPDGYDGTAGLVYEAPHAAGYVAPHAAGYYVAAPSPHEEDPLSEEPVDDPEPVANEGLRIFGDITTEEVAEDYTPTRDRPPPPVMQPGQPAPQARQEQAQQAPDQAQQAPEQAVHAQVQAQQAPEQAAQVQAQPTTAQAVPGQAGSAAAGTMIAIDSAWHGPKGGPAGEDGAAREHKHRPFGKIGGLKLPGVHPHANAEAHPEEHETMPVVRVRDLPPDVQMSFIRDRFIIVVAVGALSFIFVRSWPLSVTLMIIAFVVDVVRRQRTAVLYVNGGAHPGARKATSRQLRRMRRAGYYTLDARPIPDSREVIDHLVIGPTGVYAIDSEKWTPKLPIRTWTTKKLYHGPESQKPRLEHAAWEAAQASEILSGALGAEIKVRPALAIYGPKIPWDIATIRDVDVFTGSALGKYLKSRWRKRDDAAIRLTAEEVRTIYETAYRMLPDVANEHHPVG